MQLHLSLPVIIVPGVRGQLPGYMQSQQLVKRGEYNLGMIQVCGSLQHAEPVLAPGRPAGNARSRTTPTWDL